MIYPLLLAWSKSNQKIKAEPASLLRSIRTLTAVSALYAHQLRPEIEPDGSLGMADTACFFVILH